MARSTLGALISGTRAILTTQLVVSIVAIALAGWTMSVTNNLIRERDRLRNRVIQLEETMAGRGIVVPAAPTIVDAPRVVAQNVYPGPIANAHEAEIATTSSAPAEADAETAAADDASQGLLRRVFGDVFSPLPPMRTLVLHVRSAHDAETAYAIAAELAGESDARVLIDVMPSADARQSGYTYFDGRQSRAAADLVNQFHDVARRLEIASWSAQLRGVALPARGEYGADRLDIVLPPLPPPPVTPAAASAPAASTEGALDTPPGE
ncbi:MAG: hypothetical protein AB7O98_03265 [Hyphomonadaceae bacterium]